MEELVMMPLSFWQEGLWVFHRSNPDTCIYNLPYSIRLSGSLNVGALLASIERTIARHEILRTNFTEIDAEPVQVISPRKPVYWLYADLRQIEESTRELEAARIADQEASRPFDLRKDSLLKTVLLCLDMTDHVLLLTTHNIILDAWSLELLIQEITVCYEALTKGEAIAFADLPLQFADFAVWQREWLQGAAIESELVYWKRQLGGRLQAVDLPLDHPRPPALTYNAMSHSITLPEALGESLRNLSKKSGVTMFTTFVAAVNALLHFHKQQHEIAIGTPITLRSRSELKYVPGYLYNILILQTDLSGDPTFSELLTRVKSVARGAFAHQDLPFERLVSELTAQYRPGDTPPIQVMFIFVTREAAPREMLATTGLKVTPFARSNRTARFYLTIKIIELEKSISISFEYSIDFFESATVARMLERFERLIQAIPVDERQRLSVLRASTESVIQSQSKASG